MQRVKNRKIITVDNTVFFYWSFTNTVQIELGEQQWSQVTSAAYAD